MVHFSLICKGFGAAFEDVKHQQENQLPNFPLYLSVFIVVLQVFNLEIMTLSVEELPV